MLNWMRLFLWFSNTVFDEQIKGSLQLVSFKKIKIKKTFLDEEGVTKSVGDTA